jgi:sortase A
VIAGAAASPRRVLAAVALAAGLAGAAVAAAGLWIPAKAVLAERLIEDAWRRAAAGERRPKPRPWADTWPVARLRLPRAELESVVLAGAGGRTLAFGPGHLDGSPRPGEPGNVVIAGHRDTHFRALAGVVPGDPVVLETPAGVVRRFRVTGTAVVDHADTAALAATAGEALTLVTCWPFDALVPGGPLRWVVRAEAVAPEARRINRAPEARGMGPPPVPANARSTAGSRRSGRAARG